MPSSIPRHVRLVNELRFVIEQYRSLFSAQRFWMLFFHKLLSCSAEDLRVVIRPTATDVATIFSLPCVPRGRLTKFRTLSGINFKMLSSVKEK